MNDWRKHDPLVVGLYLTANRRARGGAKLVESFPLNNNVKARARWDDVIEAVRTEAKARGYEVRTVSQVAAPGDIHVAAYVGDKGQGFNALRARKKPVTRTGPHGGPLGRHVKKKTAKTIQRNRG